MKMLSYTLTQTYYKCYKVQQLQHWPSSLTLLSRWKFEIEHQNGIFETICHVHESIRANLDIRQVKPTKPEGGEGVYSCDFLVVRVILYYMPKESGNIRIVILVGADTKHAVSRTSSPAILIMSFRRVLHDSVMRGPPITDEKFTSFTERKTKSSISMKFPERFPAIL